MKLPIDVLPHTSPPVFRWIQSVESPVGTREIEYEGLLLASAEQAVVDLITLAKQQAHEIEELKKLLGASYDRVAKQSDALSKKSEKRK